MVPIDRKSEPDIKRRDPVPDPRASTTEEDLARAEGEGMLPASPPPAAPHPKRARRTKRSARLTP